VLFGAFGRFRLRKARPRRAFTLGQPEEALSILEAAVELIIIPVRLGCRAGAAKIANYSTT